jgi:hypothetical protein
MIMIMQGARDNAHADQRVQTAPAAVLSTWRDKYQGNQWSRFGRWDKQGSVGDAYWFQKAKDIAKSKVIVNE